MIVRKLLHPVIASYLEESDDTFEYLVVFQAGAYDTRCCADMSGDQRREEHYKIYEDRIAKMPNALKKENKTLHKNRINRNGVICLVLVCCVFFIVVLILSRPTERGEDKTHTIKENDIREDEQPEYETWHMEKQCQNMIIDADVSGFSKDCRLKKLHCSKSPWTFEEENKMISLIYPKLSTNVDCLNIQLAIVKDGKALKAQFDREAIYSENGRDDREALRIAFSDNCIFAVSEQYYPYETVTYASTAMEGYEYATCQFGDLSFSTQEETMNDAYAMLRGLNLPAQDKPFSVIAYSDDNKKIDDGLALSYRTFFMDGVDVMAPYREKVLEYGSECYQLNYSMVYCGIPTSLYTVYLAMEDMYNDPPNVSIWFNEKGVIYFRVWNNYKLVGESESYKLVGLNAALDAVDEYLGNLILTESMNCRRIRLEYYTLNYKGGIEGRDFELVPMWTFYFDNGSAPIIVNALTGNLVR